jgi:class 3 adenylate cyclase
VSEGKAQGRASSYRWLSAIGYALLTFAALSGLGFKPAWGIGLFALLAGVGALVSSELATVIAVVGVSIPIIAVAPLLGLALLVIGLAATTFLAGAYGRTFFIIALSIAGAAYGPVWAAAAAAGVLLGVSEGAVLGIVAAIVVELTGVALGRAAFGAIVAGATKPAIDLARMPDNLFKLTWVLPAMKSIGSDDAKRLGTFFSAVAHPLLLVLQPVAWGLGAALAGEVRRRTRDLGDFASGSIAAGLGVVAIAGLSAVALLVVGAPIPGKAMVTAAITSAIAAIAFVVLWERLFPHRAAAPAAAASSAAAPTRSAVATDDADVDELLRLIATAEDKLTAEHTTQKVVMITDMKSFSAMTEQDGSVLTAKAIQRHRDLLLPVIERYRGCGKSTGGDGLVAAFDVRSDALAAAAEMQRMLAAYNTEHHGERDLLVRIGIAQGEVVLDRHGRPFIGAALNLAARVMNLADGGQAFATAIVASAAGEAGVKTASLGDYELKNIAKPVEVFEVLWAEGQTPRAPGTEPPAETGEVPEVG